jgi:heme exporter protein A
VLTVTQLACGAGDRTLFRHLEFSLASGEIMQVRGVNGVGKTTLLRAIAGLGLPLEGRIQFNGEDVLSQRARWNGLMLFQGHLAGFRLHHRVLDNLRDQAMLDHGKACSDTALLQALERAGLARQRTLPVGRLSAGQKRRLGLARLTLAGHKPVWLLDEPTTALDAEGQQLLVELLREHAGRGAMAMAATHQSLGMEQTPVCVRTLEIERARKQAS